jgi:drug/metabolite transporter (DMT)-like permease
MKMNYLAILIATLLFGTQTVCFKFFNRTYMKNFASYFFFNFLYFGTVVLIFLISSGFPKVIDPYTWSLGVSFGVVFVVTIFCYMKAMETGPMSYSSLFFSFGLLVPVVFGTFLWNEKISMTQFFGLALLLITFYLCSGASGNKLQSISSKWAIFCAIAFLGNGSLMTLAKEHQILLPGQQVGSFLIIAFGTSALLSFVLFGLSYFKKQTVAHLKKLPFVLVVLGAGVTTAFGNQLAMYLNSRVPSILQFPVINGGVVILSAVASILFFGENLTIKGKIGLGLGIAALVFLCIK